jgi:S-adenosyl methyltransferase
MGASVNIDDSNTNDREPVPVVPTFVDLSKASAARAYNWYLGGDSNFEIDRRFAAEVAERFPLTKPIAWANRRWLRRVVDKALDNGITQFLDLGSGLPAMGAVHELVGNRIANGRVVYVDFEPVAHMHIELALDEIPGAERWITALREDLRNPEVILSHPKVGELIDFTQPVCILMVAVLHFVGDDIDIPELLHQYRAKVSVGSWLAISHAANDTAVDAADAAHSADALALYESSQNPACVRDYAEIRSWFNDGWELLRPGPDAPADLVHVPDWWPTGQDHDADTNRVRPFLWCAVGEKTNPTLAADEYAGGESQHLK